MQPIQKNIIKSRKNALEIRTIWKKNTITGMANKKNTSTAATHEKNR